MRLSDWSPEVIELRHLAARLEDLIAAVVVTRGGTAPRYPKLPRPRVAAQRIRERQALAVHRRAAAILLKDHPNADLI